VALRLHARLPALAAVRARHARGYATALAGAREIELIEPFAGATPAWVRYPLLVRVAAGRAALIAALDADGIGATASYPAALPDVPEVAARAVNARDDFPGARSVAARIVTLPTHPYCPDDIASRVATHLGTAGRAPARAAA
jgi:dTDP-4-amino-4,6-dideoxygalactose transaminase